MLRLITRWSLPGLLTIALVTPAAAQYSDVPQALPVPSPSTYSSAVQIGRTLFVAGAFSRLNTFTGGAVVVDAAGRPLPDRFPQFMGPVNAILADGGGGWFVGGAFTSVDGQPVAGVAHVGANRRVDNRIRLAADGPVRQLALAHGRLYVVGDFTRVNGAARAGLAAFELSSGALSAWGVGFTAPGALLNLSISSTGVYVSTEADGGHLWGFEAGSGRVLFDKRMVAHAVAATSARVYVSGGTSTRPIWAVDPRTGEDTGWQVGLTFDYIADKYYGFDVTRVRSLLVADGRLYFAGTFRASGGRNVVAAVDLTTGDPVPWTPRLAPPAENFVGPAWLSRVGPALLAGPPGVAAATGMPAAFDAVTAAPLAFAPALSGAVAAVAPAPEGAVVGGSVNGTDGVSRAGLAAIDLDTNAVTPWSSTWPGTPDSAVGRLATDGHWLFATGGRYFASTTRLAKLDPTTGALVAEQQVPGTVLGWAVAGGDLVVATNPSTGGVVAAAITVLHIDDWSIRALPTTLEGELFDVAAEGDAIYLAGRFFRVNNTILNSKTAAVHRTTGALLPWHTYADGDVLSLETWAGRVFASGAFTRIGGQRRRSVAELDAVTGAARSWNPDVDGGSVTIAPDGTLFVNSTGGHAAGQEATGSVAYSATTGARLPWRHVGHVTAALADCVLTGNYCLRRAVSSPGPLRVATSGATVTLDWSLPVSPARTGVRVEVGRGEGDTDVTTIDLPADQASLTAPAPPGRYVARVRALAGTATSLPTADVSFAVGPPDVPGAPLDLTAIMRPPFLHLAWTPPSTGAPLQYLLEAGTAPGASDLGALPLPGSIRSFVVDPPDTRIWVRLVAVSAAGRSTASRDAFFNAIPNFTCGVLPPRNLAAQVSGRQVTLTWEAPADGAEGGYLAVGSSPGGSDLGSIQMPLFSTSYSVAAPPGTYYVRAYAPCVATPSNEVRVVVP